jgi:hypothetical protein
VGNAQVGPNEWLEPDDVDRSLERAQDAADEAEVDAADHVGATGQEADERAAAQVDLSLDGAGERRRETSVVEEDREAARCFRRLPGRREVPREAASPSVARRNRRRGRLGSLGELIGQRPGQLPVGLLRLVGRERPIAE